jgi:aspartokinase-like uncharacterized kinase
MITLVLLVLLGFAVFYPCCYFKREKLLHQVHGKDFEEYCKRVPRFFPNFKLYTEPEKYVLKPDFIEKRFLMLYGLFWHILFWRL